jgi:ferric-dicitrate binding protein FerR (iron transport regulator)
MPDSKPLERTRDQFCLAGGGSVVITLRPRTPAVARAINYDHTVRGGEFFAECETHILQISARSVDENDRWVGAGRVVRKAEHGNMQPDPLDLDKLASWRMSVLEFGHP